MAQRQIIIRRAKPKETTIQNSIIWDNNISSMARFSLIAMLSLPDSWDYSVRGMAVMLKVSKDTMGKYIKELEEAGYLQRRQAHGDAGKFCNTQYILTDTPGDFGTDTPCPDFSDTDTPCPNLPDPVEPDPEKSPQKKRSSEQKKRTEQSSPLTPQGAGSTDKRPKGKRAKTEPAYRPDWFERFWALYPRRTNRVAAVRAWDKLQPDLELCKVMTVALRAQMQTSQWMDGPEHIPHPSTWLNGARWLDEVSIPAAPDPGGYMIDTEVY